VPRALTPFTAITWVFATLLVVAGAHKVAAPDATTAALQGARLPSDHWLVRVLGAAEVAVGLAVVVVGGTVPSAIMAVMYAGFAGFVARQAGRGEDCGCFGSQPAPATRLHVGVNAIAAVAAAAAAVAPGPSLPAAFGAAPLTGALTIGLLALAVAGVRLLLTALPSLAATTARLLEEGRA